MILNKMKLYKCPAIVALVIIALSLTLFITFKYIYSDELELQLVSVVSK